MTIADVVKILDGKLMAGDGTSPRAVGAVVANDLMSDVLLNAWWCTTRSRSPRRC